MRNKKILIILQGIKLGLDTIEIIKVDFRQKRIEILSKKLQEEIKKIENHKSFWKIFNENYSKVLKKFS